MVSLTRALSFLLLLKFVEMAVPGDTDLVERTKVDQQKGADCLGNQVVLAMKTDDLKHVRTFDKVIGVRLLDVSEPIPAEWLEDCMTECDKVLCAAFLYYYLKEMCIVARGWEESMPSELESLHDINFAFFVTNGENPWMPKCFRSEHDFDEYREVFGIKALTSRYPMTPAVPSSRSILSSAVAIEEFYEMATTKIAQPMEKSTASTTTTDQKGYSTASRGSNPTAATPVFSYTPFVPEPPTLSTRAWQAISEYFGASTEDGETEKSEKPDGEDSSTKAGGDTAEHSSPPTSTSTGATERPTEKHTVITAEPTEKTTVSMTATERTTTTRSIEDQKTPAPSNANCTVMILGYTHVMGEGTELSMQKLVYDLSEDEMNLIEKSENRDVDRDAKIEETKELVTARWGNFSDDNKKKLNGFNFTVIGYNSTLANFASVEGCKIIERMENGTARPFTTNGTRSLLHDPPIFVHVTSRLECNCGQASTATATETTTEAPKKADEISTGTTTKSEDGSSSQQGKTEAATTEGQTSPTHSPTDAGARSTSSKGIVLTGGLDSSCLDSECRCGATEELKVMLQGYFISCLRLKRLDENTWLALGYKDSQKYEFRSSTFEASCSPSKRGFNQIECPAPVAVNGTYGSDSIECTSSTEFAKAESVMGGRCDDKTVPVCLDGFWCYSKPFDLSTVFCA